MSHSYSTFKKYPDAKQARALQEFLLENGVECIFINNSSQLGSGLSGDLMQEYELQLHPDNFEKAEALLEKQAETMITDLPEDYYLLSFTDEELHDVVLKHDEWNEFDYLLARKLLEERGKTIDEAHLKTMRVERLNELSKPEAINGIWIGIGYVMSLAGGFFGFITGYVLMASRKTLPNGAMVHTYDEGTRKHGKIMLIISVAVMAIGTAFFLIR